MCRASAATKMEAVHPLRLNSTTDLQQQCTGQLGLCVIGLLNPGTAEHRTKLDDLGAVAMKESGKVSSFPIDRCCATGELCNWLRSLA